MMLATFKAYSLIHKRLLQQLFFLNLLTEKSSKLLELGCGYVTGYISKVWDIQDVTGVDFLGLK